MLYVELHFRVVSYHRAVYAAPCCWELGYLPARFDGTLVVSVSPVFAFSEGHCPQARGVTRGHDPLEDRWTCAASCCGLADVGTTLISQLDAISPNLSSSEPSLSDLVSDRCCNSTRSALICTQK